MNIAGDPGATVPEPAEPPAPPRREPRRLSRLARIVLLGGALAVAAVILPRLPRDREVEFRVENAATIIGIELTWSREDGSGEPMQGGSWRFEPGLAPRSLSTSVHLPSGRYAVDVTVDRTQGHDELHRVIELANADHVTIPLR